MGVLKSIRRLVGEWRDALVISFIVVSFLVWHYQGATEDQLRVSQLRSCHRLNVLRAEDNRSQLYDYRVYSLTLSLLGTALAHPQQPTTSRQRQEGVEYLARIRDDMLGKEWVGLTQCFWAVEHPLTYVAPVPTSFAKRLPPSSALTVGPGE